MRRMTIRGRMIVLIVLPTLAIYIIVIGLTMRHLQGKRREAIETEMTRLAQNYAARFDGYLREAATIAQTTAASMETRPDATERQLFAQLERNVRERPFIYGAAMAFEPGTFKTDDSLFSPYVYRDGDQLAEMDINRSVYDWYGDDRWQWFRGPKREGHGLWTAPYFDEGAGNVLMVTYSAPFGRDGAFRGVTTVDIEIPLLNETVGRSIVGDQAFYVIAQDGIFVYSSKPDQLGRSIYEVAQERGRPDLEEIARRITSGDSGISTFAGVEGVDPPGSIRWVFYAPIESTGWAFVAEMYERDVLAVERRRMAIASTALGATLLLIIGSIVYVSGHIARPIVKLRSRVMEISSGNLDARVEGVETSDEIGDLARSFNKMTENLRGMVDRLAEEQSERAKIERDLDLAREIQQGLLPRELPNTPGFDIAGWNQAAEKTGGDYFDWLELPDGRTIVTLADVTGHGIGPALIVAVCRAYMRASASGEVDLAQALARVNDLLYTDMPDGRFVTAVVCLVNPEDATMTLLSAGQAPILFYEAKSGRVHEWDADHPPLAVLNGAELPQARVIQCEPGDMLVLTTDGFFEWADPSGEQFGTARLTDFVRAHNGLPPEDLIRMLHETVLEHARGTEQADDLTAVVIKKM